MNIKTTIALLLLSISLVACSGGSGTSSITEKSAVGKLMVSVSGLPDGVQADITLSGNGVNQLITASETISDLKTGNYSLDVITVSNNEYDFSAEVSSYSLMISSGQTTEAPVAYLTNEVISDGVITGFGSVYVNGVHFNTDSAEFETDENEQDDLNKLSLGMVVSVKGTLSADGNEGVAKNIRHSDNIRGPIDSIDLASPSLTVLSQFILVDDQTVFHGADFDVLEVDQVVSIDVVETDEGELLATRVKLNDDDEEDDIPVFKLSGNISELDTELMTFKVFDISVNYAGALVNGTLEDGVRVSIKSHQIITDGIFIAENIKVFRNHDDNGNGNSGNESDDDNHRNYVINEFVTEFISAEAFKLGDFDVTTDENTEYRGGTADDIQEGIRLNVHGRINEEGKLVAKKVRFDKPGVIKVQGEVTAVNAEGLSIEILDILFVTDNNTTYRDKSDADDKHFHFDAIEIGDWLKIDAFEQQDDSMLAKKVTRLDDTNETKIVGRVESFESPTLVIKGVTIEVSELTDIEGPDQGSLDMAAFFALLTSDTKLKVEGLLDDDGVLQATSIEFNHEDHEEDEGEDNNKVAIVGDIDEFVSETEFSVNGHAIITDEDTEFKHGSVEDLALGVRIQVKGIVDEEGTILAKRILFQNGNDNSNRVELEGEVDTFDSVESFTVNGHGVITTSATKYLRGNMDDLMLGAEVEVNGTLNEDEVLVADKIKFED